MLSFFCDSLFPCVMMLLNFETALLLYVHELCAVFRSLSDRVLI